MLQMILFILSALNITTFFYADLMRPVVIFNLLSQLRFSFLEFLRDLKASASILFSIFCWITFFTLAGYYLFRYSFEGLKHFYNLEMSFISLLNSLTTANFPDVMLEAYFNNYFVSFFFIVYMLIGLYFLLSFLIAHVFNNYKRRLEERINMHEKKRRA